jgi:cell division protein DivIC
MAGRRIAPRKKRQNTFSMLLVSAVVITILITVSVRSSELREKLDTYVAKQEQLEKQINKEKDRSVEIEEFGKYTQTKKYAEEVAKDKMGLVYEDEIIFKEGE